MVSDNNLFLQKFKQANKWETFLKVLVLMILFYSFCHHDICQAQQIDETTLKEACFKNENQLNELKKKQIQLNRQGDSLAVTIHELRNKKNINIFQRQKLESLLKSSQVLVKQINKIDKEIGDVQAKYEKNINKLLKWYDIKIQNTLNTVTNAKLTQEDRKFYYEKIQLWRSGRDECLKKLRGPSVNMIIMKDIEINENDSYEKIKQKADLIKDQEDKLRNKRKFVDKKVKDLEKELKLRNRMNELISDTYLMDHRLEIVPGLQQKNETDKNREWIFTGGIDNQGVSDKSVEFIDDLIFRTDLSTIPDLDLELYIQNLKKLETNLEKSADSLKHRADQFYKAAEKKRGEKDK